MKTSHLKLVPLSEEYAEELLPLWNDFEVIKYTNASQLNTIEECKDRIQSFLEQEPYDVIRDYVILFHNEVIGIVGTPIIDEEAKEAGFYYQLKRNYWGEGFGYEAARAVLRHAMVNLNMNTIYADSVVANPASIRILRRLGFEETGIERKGFCNNGIEMNVIHFQMRQEALVGC